MASDVVRSKAVVLLLLIHCLLLLPLFVGSYLKDILRAATRENLSSGVCEQHRRRPACASAHTDQRLCYLPFGKYHM